MDVARPILITGALAGSLFLSACAEMTSNSSTPIVNKPSAQCADSVIPNRFVVEWKDGITTVEYAANAEELERELLEPNAKDVVSADHDYLVKIRAPDTVEAQGVQGPEWGQIDVGAQDAWTIASGEGITVAVVDSGADITHPQLQSRVAINTGEIAGNGKDDDGNGFVDDVYGYNFYDYGRSGGSSVVADGVVGHGTHVSGIILAAPSADPAMSQMKGMAPKAKLIPLNFMNDDGEGAMSDAVSAIDYAVARGAKIINASWGGPMCSGPLRKKIMSLAERNVLFVAAAGNGDYRTGIGYNLETRPDYPAAVNGPSQLTVGAVAPSGAMTSFSNFSQSLVHLMAPGSRILSTFPMSGSQCSSSAGSGYCYMSGTSMATPFVSGIAALVWSYRPNATVFQVRQAIMASVTLGDYPAVSRGRVHARRALDEIAKLVAP